MKADSMPDRLLIGPGSPPSIDPVYPELSPPPEPCRKDDGPSLTRRVGIGAAHAVAIGRGVLSILAESLGGDQLNFRRDQAADAT